MKTKNKLELRLEKEAPIGSLEDLNATYNKRVDYLIKNKKELLKDPNYQRAVDDSYGIYWATLRGKENEHYGDIVKMYKSKELYGLGCVL